MQNEEMTSPQHVCNYDVVLSMCNPHTQQQTVKCITQLIKFSHDRLRWEVFNMWPLFAVYTPMKQEITSALIPLCLSQCTCTMIQSAICCYLNFNCQGAGRELCFVSSINILSVIVTNKGRLEPEKAQSNVHRIFIYLFIWSCSVAI